MNHDTNAEKSTYYDLASLLMSYALDMLKEKCPNYVEVIDSLIDRADRVLTYPDGTLLLDGGGTFKHFLDVIIQQQLYASGGIEDLAAFVSVEPFPYKAYCIWGTYEYFESLGEDGFHVWFPRLHTMPTSDYKITELQITVIFKRLPSSRARESFAECLSNYFQSVSEKGLFGEGPIKKASDSISFRGPLAQFQVNVSHSGQDTLNWLLLSVLNFGHKVSGVVDFIFDQEKQLRNIYGPIPNQIIEVPIN